MIIDEMRTENMYLKSYMYLFCSFWLVMTHADSVTRVTNPKNRDLTVDSSDRNVPVLNAQVLLSVEQ